MFNEKVRTNGAICLGGLYCAGAVVAHAAGGLLLRHSVQLVLRLQVRIPPHAQRVACAPVDQVSLVLVPESMFRANTSNRADVNLCEKRKKN